MRNVNCPQQRTHIITTMWRPEAVMPGLKLPLSPAQGMACVRNRCGHVLLQTRNGVKMASGGFFPGCWSLNPHSLVRARPLPHPRQPPGLPWPSSPRVGRVPGGRTSNQHECPPLMFRVSDGGLWGARVKGEEERLQGPKISF